MAVPEARASRGDAPPRPNILFLLSDQHSYRFLSALSPEQGGEPCRTPALDRLAGEGVRFSTAYCQMPLCTPSRTAPSWTSVLRAVAPASARLL